jgi:sialate O-acetylesterase
MKKIIVSSALSVILLIATATAFANVKLPAIIADDMVLQQNTTVNLWGWADPGEAVQVSDTWNSASVKTVADAQGKWLVKVKTSKAGGPYTISIRGKNKIDIHNVLLGEVWLCSGQSNMTFPLEKEASWRTGVFNYEQEIAQANYPNIRMFIVKETVADEPMDNVQGDWNVCVPANAGRFSATAYYFAREIYKATGFPVGLVHSSWGGTPAESWTKKEVLESDADLKPILDRYTQDVKQYPQAVKDYESKLAQWKITSAEDSVKGIRVQPAPKKPADPLTSSQSPSKLYNAMIHPLIAYTIQGVIWYQGESNSDRAYQYRKLFPALINSWRSDWKTELPFYFVQIAPQYSKIPEIREAQLLTFKSVNKTGMAVITDSGDSLNIHPRNKDIVGKRLSLWPLAQIYGKKDLVYSGPIYKSIKIEQDKARISFDFVDGGLMAKDGSLKEFTIAGEDQKFVPANATIDGNTIVVSSDEVKHPVAVRFAWKNFPRPNLYNNAGLPASPFRTDTWPAETFGKN